MKDFVSKVLTKIKASGVSAIDVAYLKDNSWFHVNSEVLTTKTVFIFKGSGQLLISKDGDITKATWENLIHSTNSLIIEIYEKPALYNIILLTSDYLVIQKDGTENVEVFIKQQRYDTKLPKNPDDNPINIIYDDLKMLLNRRNNDLAEPDSEVKIISAPQAISTKSDLSSFDLNGIVRETVSNVLNDSQSNYSYPKTVEKIEILNKIKERYYLTKDDEVKFFLEMEAVEDELISEGVQCFVCKSSGDINIEICSVCKDNLLQKNN